MDKSPSGSPKTKRRRATPKLNGSQTSQSSESQINMSKQQTANQDQGESSQKHESPESAIRQHDDYAKQRLIMGFYNAKITLDQATNYLRCSIPSAKRMDVETWYKWFIMGNKDLTKDFKTVAAATKIFDILRHEGGFAYGMTEDEESDNENDLNGNLSEANVTSQSNTLEEDDENLSSGEDGDPITQSTVYSQIDINLDWDNLVIRCFNTADGSKVYKFQENVSIQRNCINTWHEGRIEEGIKMFKTIIEQPGVDIEVLHIDIDRSQRIHPVEFGNRKEHLYTTLQQMWKSLKNPVIVRDLTMEVGNVFQLPCVLEKIEIGKLESIRVTCATHYKCDGSIFSSSPHWPVLKKFSLTGGILFNLQLDDLFHLERASVRFVDKIITPPYVFDYAKKLVNCGQFKRHYFSGKFDKPFIHHLFSNWEGSNRDRDSEKFIYDFAETRLIVEAMEDRIHIYNVPKSCPYYRTYANVI